MRVRSIEITEEVADVLRASTWQETTLILPPGQLDRKLYEAVNKVLTALGGKWNRHAKGHVFAAAAASAELVAALDTGSVVDRKKTLELFETPPEIAHRMAMMAMTARPDARRFLEPEAGTGRLIYALYALNPAAPLDLLAIEIDAANVEALRAQGFARRVVHADLFDLIPNREYRVDVILMNPPFGNNADIEHVDHVFNEWLAPDGVLVAIMSPHWTFANDTASRDFRALLGFPDGFRLGDQTGIELSGSATVAGATAERLPEGTFKGEGTGVGSLLVTMRKSTDALGFDEDHSVGARRRGRDGRSISHSYGGEGRNFVD